MDDNEDKIVLRRELGLKHAISLCISGLIGSGIFVSPVGILSHVGSIGTSLTLWLFCGICQVLFGLCFAELGCRIPISGGHYMYLNEVFGGLLACMKLWSGLLGIVFAFSVSYGILGRYLLDPLFVDCAIPDSMMKLTYITAHSLIIAMNLYSVRLVAKTQVIFSAAKVLALCGVIMLGFICILSGEIGQLANPFEGSVYTLSSYALAFYSGAWSLSGWEYICCVTGEMKNPQRDLRLSLMISIGLTTVIYMFANVAYATVLTKEEMLASPAVAVTFARKTMGPVWWIMPLCVALSVFGSALGTILGESRIFYMGAKKGHLPYILSFISIERRTPFVSILLLGLLGCAGVGFKDVFYAMELCGFISIFFQLLTILALIILRYQKQNPNTEIVKAPFAVPELCFVLDFILLVLTVYKRPVATCGFLFTMSVVFTILYIACVRKKKPKKYYNFRDKTMEIIQKWLLCVPEED